MNEHKIEILRCPKCEARIIIDNTIEMGYSNHEEFSCPLCDTFIEKIQSNMSYEIINVLDKK